MTSAAQGISFRPEPDIKQMLDVAEGQLLNRTRLINACLREVLPRKIRLNPDKPVGPSGTGEGSAGRN